LGWCNKILKEKANEFGQPNPDMTYLRITMGVNQGDSPGVPFVMEIWPPGHYSPVHNHAGANAVIRVLHGEITVNLYPMLSKYHLQPFGVAKFGKDDVTWISPDLNQTHQLRNTNVAGPTCITIQCYMYGEGNTQHYSYFDYLNSQGQEEQFDPNSDMDYLPFKELMKREWITMYNYK
jgi:predicted metal-dependent enzyme (double-stranded beta helix superfamily)